MNQMPTIRIEMDGLKYQVIHAFTDSLDELKDYAKEVITASMNELEKEGLERTIIEAVKMTMQDAIYQSLEDVVKEAVEEYFSEGEGQKFISDAILGYLRDKK